MSNLLLHTFKFQTFKPTFKHFKVSNLHSNVLECQTYFYTFFSFTLSNQHSNILKSHTYIYHTLHYILPPLLSTDVVNSFGRPSIVCLRCNPLTLVFLLRHSITTLSLQCLCALMPHMRHLTPCLIKPHKSPVQCTQKVGLRYVCT